MKTDISDLANQRPTFAAIDLDAIHSNFLEVRRHAPQSAVMAVIKADGYGHGAVRIARELESAGAACFGTATVSEAIELRDAGVKVPILVLGGMIPSQLPVLHDYDIMPAIHTMEFWKALCEYAPRLEREIKVHVKVDSGMGRLGLTEDDADKILKAVPPGIVVDGLFTHFACADTPEDGTAAEQNLKFESFLKTHATGIRWIHAANSAAILNLPSSHHNMVRPGMLLYGLGPVGMRTNLIPAMTLTSSVIALRRIRKGQSIGYGHSFVAGRESLIATVPIGYSDGLRRSLSNRLEIDIDGRLCRIAGTISMDLCMVDVTDLQPAVRLYDPVTLIGPKTTAWDWAKLLDSIAYEVICLIGSRVPRVYYKKGKVVDVYYP